MFTETLGSWHKVCQRKTATDWAYEMKELHDEDYATDDKVILLMENLKTHNVTSFYEVFKPKEVRCLIKSLEIHLVQYCKDRT